MMLSAMREEALFNIAYGSIMGQLREKVKELRCRTGWPQEDMAQEMDVSLSTVQR